MKEELLRNGKFPAVLCLLSFSLESGGSVRARAESARADSIPLLCRQSSIHPIPIYVPIIMFNEEKVLNVKLVHLSYCVMKEHFGFRFGIKHTKHKRALILI
jgi:hypothetical protein